MQTSDPWTGGPKYLLFIFKAASWGAIVRDIVIDCLIDRAILGPGACEVGEEPGAKSLSPSVF